MNLTSLRRGLEDPRKLTLEGFSRNYITTESRHTHAKTFHISDNK